MGSLFIIPFTFVTPVFANSVPFCATLVAAEPTFCAPVAANFAASSTKLFAPFKKFFTAPGVLAAKNFAAAWAPFEIPFTMAFAIFLIELNAFLPKFNTTFPNLVRPVFNPAVIALPILPTNPVKPPRILPPTLLTTAPNAFAICANAPRV